MQSRLGAATGPYRPRCSPHFRCDRASAPWGANAAAPRAAGGRRRAVVVRAERSLYEVLGVEPGASERDIKRAYRQKALKLHPDVNKAPDAEARFMEVKNAFAVLSDAQQRADYDRRRRFGGGGGGAGSWGSWGAGAGAGGFGGGSSWGGVGGGAPGSRPRPKTEEEEFYGLGDFFRDLEKEAEEWSKKRAAARGPGAAAKPLSLWEELAAIGEEFVEYLESTLPSGEEGDATDGGRAKGEGARASAASGGGGGGRRSPLDAYEDLKRRYDMDGAPDGGGGSTTQGRAASKQQQQQQARPPPPPPPKKKSADEEVDEMLAALKKKMGKA